MENAGFDSYTIHIHLSWIHDNTFRRWQRDKKSMADEGEGTDDDDDESDAILQTLKEEDLKILK